MRSSRSSTRCHITNIRLTETFSKDSTMGTPPQSNSILFPFNKYSPPKRNIAHPMYAPVTIVTGHFCHSLSQSSGIGTAPSHAPTCVHNPLLATLSYNHMNSTHQTPNHPPPNLIKRHPCPRNLPPHPRINTVHIKQRQHPQQRYMRRCEQAVP